MNKRILWLLFGFLLVVVGLVFYITFQVGDFTANEIKRNLLLKQYTIDEEKRINHQLYVTLKVSADEGRELVSRHHFTKSCDSLAKGAFHNDFIQCRPGFLYYFKTRQDGRYSNMVVSVSPSFQQIEMYELLGD